jgi:hypothetical protein
MIDFFADWSSFVIVNISGSEMEENRNRYMVILDIEKYYSNN